MDASGPGPSGPGPDAFELEAARQRMYRPDATPEDAERYARLVADLERHEAPPPAAVEAPTAEPGRGDEQPAGTAVQSRPASWRRIAVVGATGVVVLGLLVALLLPHGPARLPDYLPPPSADGTTLTTLARLSDPRTAPDLLTFTPQGYTVFQPEGRSVRVGIRCQGAGRVIISAGRQFVFHCRATPGVLRLVGPATSKPFVVIGVTRGNVVWAARITAR